MKKSCIILVIACVILLLCSCSSNGYRIEIEGEKYFIHLGEENGSSVGTNSNSSVYEEPLYFDSISEMKSDLETGNFTDEELVILASFDRDTNSRVEICNLSKLYEPVYPQYFSDYTVSLRGTQYNYFLSNSTYDYFISLFFFCQKGYHDDLIDHYTHSYEGNDSITVHSITTDPETGATIIDLDSTTLDKTVETWRFVYHTVTDGDKVLNIYRKYKMEGSEYVLKITRIVGTDEGLYFVISFNQEIPLTLDELSQFGIREYVETVTE